jgi:hypothetical protein
MINPVLTKLATFATLTAARHIIGQPWTTLDLGQAVMAGQIVVVNLARGVIGGDLAALLGALLVSAVDLAIERQATAPPDDRRRVLVAIDELQTLPAVDYARLVGELRKYGGGFLLATQTLTGLDRLDPTLRPLLLGNCEALLSFRVAAEDAALLTAEFDEAIAVTDLTNLERGCAYLKASERGQPAPASWLRVHPPVAPDPMAALVLRARGRERWGVPAVAAAAAVAAGQARVQALTDLVLDDEAKRQPAEAGRTATAASGGAGQPTSTLTADATTTRDTPAPATAAQPAGPGASPHAAPPTTGEATTVLTALPPPTRPAGDAGRGHTRRGRRPSRAARQLPLTADLASDTDHADTLEDDHDRTADDADFTAADAPPPDSPAVRS